MAEEKYFFDAGRFEKSAPKQIKKVIKGIDLKSLDGREVRFDKDAYGSADYVCEGKSYVLYPVDKDWCVHQVQEAFF